MGSANLTRRSTLAGMMGGVAGLSAMLTLPSRAFALTQSAASASDGVLTIDFDSGMHSRIARRGEYLTPIDASEGVRLADGKVLDRYTLLTQQRSAAPNGTRYTLTG